MRRPRYRELLPQAQRMAVLVNAPDPFVGPMLQKIQDAGRVAGVAIDPVIINDPAGLDSAFAGLEDKRPDAIIVQPSLPTRQVAELAIARRLPAISPSRQFAEAGGLMNYAVSEVDLYRGATAMVVKVLKGARPADLPVEQPTRFDLVLNLRTARALGLTIPIAFLQRADEVIE